MADRVSVMSWLEGLAQDDWRQYHSDSEVQEIARSALALLEEQESIVRCKDCEYWNAGTCFCGCHADFITDADWFCAEGERR